jgi:hypothetical protein
MTLMSGRRSDGSSPICEGATDALIGSSRSGILAILTKLVDKYLHQLVDTTVN